MTTRTLKRHSHLKLTMWSLLKRKQKPLEIARERAITELSLLEMNSHLDHVMGDITRILKGFCVQAFGIEHQVTENEIIRVAHVRKMNPQVREELTRLLLDILKVRYGLKENLDRLQVNAFLRRARKIVSTL